MQKMNVNSKDRIICVTNIDRHEFFYQPYKSNNRIFLFRTRKFFGSVFAHFRKKGRAMPVRGWALTCGELYKFNKRNVKLTKIMETIAEQVNDVVANDFWRYEPVAQPALSMSTIRYKLCYVYDEERAA